MAIDSQLLLNLAVGLFVGAVGGYLGSLMVLKRMALVGDALSHVALPGMGFALLYGMNPLFGAFVSLFAGVLAIWFIEIKTKLPTEALVGVLFTVSLAVGFLVTPEQEVLEALFGDIARTTVLDGIIAIVVSLVIFAITKKIYSKIVLSTISEDLARSNSARATLYQLLYLLLVAGIVALGVKVVGALLMGALVIIPAVASRNIARSIASYAALSLIGGALATVLGILLAAKFHLLPGPVVVLAAATLFFFSILVRSKN